MGHLLSGILRGSTEHRIHRVPDSHLKNIMAIG